MDVNGPGPVSNLFPVKPAASVSNIEQPPATQPVAPLDDVEISAAGKMLDRLSQSPKVHAERLARIKAEIDAGRYETPEKLEAALMKLMDELGLHNDDNSS